jgi:hypothetical protein
MYPGHYLFISPPPPVVAKLVIYSIILLTLTYCDIFAEWCAEQPSTVLAVFSYGLWSKLLGFTKRLGVQTPLFRCEANLPCLFLNRMKIHF